MKRITFSFTDNQEKEVISLSVDCTHLGAAKITQAAMDFIRQYGQLAQHIHPNGAYIIREYQDDKQIDEIIYRTSEVIDFE